MDTKLTPKAEFVIAMEEGVVPTRYRDKVGVDTWGIGHTAKAGDPDPRKMTFSMPANVEGAVAEALRVYRSDLRRCVQDVLDNFGPMEPHELAGWTNWHFNTGGAHTSSARAKWRAGDKAGAVRVLKSWNKVTRNGKKEVSPVLVKRRDIEAGMILNKQFPSTAPGLPVWPTNGAGKVIWRELYRLTLEDYQRIAGHEAPRSAITPAAGAGAAIGGGLIVALAAFWDQIKELLPWL